MKQTRQNGEVIFLVDGVDHQNQTIAFGMPQHQLKSVAERGSNVRLAQFLAIVDPGLILADHVFKGLKRPLCDGKDMNADGSKLVFCWTPAFDCWWSDSSRFDPTKLEIRDAPEERVFVVIVSPNSMKAKYPAVDCWIEHWNWVRRSDVVASAPEDYQNRYSEQLK